nr:hypothetical protein [Myxococcota bacterium]
MHKTIWVAVTALAVGGCGKSKDGTDDKQGAGASVAAPKPPAASEPAAPKAGLDLFTGKTAALPPPVDKVVFRMPAGEAKAAAPDVFAAQYGYKVPGYDGVEIKVHLDKTDRVFGVRIELPEPLEAAKSGLAAKWGEPRATKNSIGAAEYYWHDLATGVRAKLEARATKSVLLFSEAQALDQQLGTTPGRFGFETTPLLGATREDVLKAYEARNARPRDEDADSLIWNLPPHEYSEYGGSVSALVKAGKVSGYTVSLSWSWDEAGRRRCSRGSRPCSASRSRRARCTSTTPGRRRSRRATRRRVRRRSGSATSRSERPRGALRRSASGMRREPGGDRAVLGDEPRQLLHRREGAVREPARVRPVAAPPVQP